MDTFDFGFVMILSENEPIESGDFVEGFLSHGPNHLACMYLCLLHGPIYNFLSCMHFLAAMHKILIKLLILSTSPTNTLGSFLTSLLYSSLPFAISNSAWKFSSIITLTSPFSGFVLSITSKNVCSPT